MAKVKTELKNTGYEIFIGILSVLSIFNLVLLYAFVDDQAMQTVLQVMNALFSAIFLGDFTYRMVTAPSRTTYFFRHFGWADLLASLPFPQFKVLRIFRLIRVTRLLREVGIRTIWRTLIRDRAGSALLILLLMGILVLQFGSLMVLQVEQYAKGANITSASDALWYTMVTISTVGYGDQYPVTNAGRLVGTVIIIVGVGIFGTFTGYLANLFLSPRKEDEEPAAGESDGAEPASIESTAGIAAEATIPSDAAPDDSAVTLDELRALLLRSQAELAEIKRLVDAGGGAPAGERGR